MEPSSLAELAFINSDAPGPGALALAGCGLLFRLGWRFARLRSAA